VSTHYDRMANAFEGRELEPIYDTTRTGGPSRSRFQRMMKQGSLTSLGNTPQPIQLVVAPSHELVRIKRLRFHFVVPQNNSNIAGWLGFVRAPEGMSADSGASAVAPGDPALLRPIVWQSADDHSVYYDAYLPAVNLATGGTLAIMGATFSGTHKLYGVATWVEERD